jgi:hypothetical protein
MLYEINTLPWSYSRPDNNLEAQAKSLQMQWDTLFIVATIFAMFAVLFSMFLFRRRRIRDHADRRKSLKKQEMSTTVDECTEETY